MNESSQKKAIRTSKTKQEPKTNDERIEIGEQATNFVKSKEYKYLETLLDSMEENLLLDKLNLRKDNVQGLNDITVKLDLLIEIKLAVKRDINLGETAKVKQAREFANAKPN